MPTHPHPSMPPHLHHNMPPHLYPVFTPRQVCLCPYCNSTPMYIPYLFLHYPHMSSLGCLHTSSSILPSCVLTPHSSKKMSEYRRKRINITSDEAKQKRRPSMNITDG